MDNKLIQQHNGANDKLHSGPMDFKTQLLMFA